MWLRGRVRDTHVEVTTDEPCAAELYRAIPRRNPVHGRFAGMRVEPERPDRRIELSPPTDDSAPATHQ